MTQEFTKQEVINYNNVAVVCFSNNRMQQAEEFCCENNIPLLKNKLKTKDNQYQLLLRFYDDIIELYDAKLNTSILIDFLSGTMAHRHQFGGGRGQAIAKAVGLGAGITPSILDTTAGLAGDAFVLATLGCPIIMLERSAVVYCLIENAIERASLNEKFETILNQGFTVINCDADNYIKQYSHSDTASPDVIYIDPMYPHRKKSALVKKDMQILQRLHGADESAAELLNSALKFAKKRVVVKRPLQAETLNEKKPNTCIKSKKTRYDVYTIEKMQTND